MRNTLRFKTFIDARKLTHLELNSTVDTALKR